MDSIHRLYATGPRAARPRGRPVVKPARQRSSKSVLRQGFRLRPRPAFEPPRDPSAPSAFQPRFKLKLRDWGDAEHHMCKAIARLGELAGVDVGMGLGPEDMDDLLIEAAHQCHFDDAEFMDGPCCFGFVRNVVDVDILKLQADTVAQGLAAYIRAHGDGEAIAEVPKQLARVDAAFAWLRQHTARRS